MQLSRAVAGRTIAGARASKRSAGVRTVGASRGRNSVREMVFSRAAARRSVCRARTMRVVAMSGAYEQPQVRN